MQNCLGSYLTKPMSYKYILKDINQTGKGGGGNFITGGPIKKNEILRKYFVVK